MDDALATLTDLVGRPNFLLGLAVGIGAAALLSIVPDESHPRGSWGLTAAAAGMLTLALVGSAPALSSLSLALLVAGGLLLRRRGWLGPMGWLVAGAGAALAGASAIQGPGIQLGLPLAILGIGALTGGWERMPSHAVVGPMLAVTAFGVWVAVPDTEVPRALLGLALPLAVPTALGSRRLDMAGALALAGVLAWVVLDSSGPRAAVVAGAMGTFGLLPLLPVAPERSGPLVEDHPLLLLAAHVALVAASSRVVVTWESGAVATVALVGAALLIGMWVQLLPRPGALRGRGTDI